MIRPLLVVDGDSFAHRAYYGLPKTIRRRGSKGGGAIVGFANFLLRLYETEQPRAVLVGWDSLDEPTYRHEALPTYQSGREFDDELVDQLEILPDFVAACGFANAKAPGYEADDFLAAAVAREERRKGTAVVATGDRDAFQLASEQTTILQPVKVRVRWRELARLRYANGMGSSRARSQISLPCAATPPTEFRVRKVSGRRAPLLSCANTRSLDALLAAGRFPAQAEELRLYRSIATMDISAPLPALRNQAPTWERASALAREWEMNRLADRLAELARQ